MTNALEREIKEIKRRAEFVGGIPHPEALLRLVDLVLIDQHDEWAPLTAATSPRPPWLPSPAT